MLRATGGSGVRVVMARRQPACPPVYVDVVPRSASGMWPPDKSGPHRVPPHASTHCSQRICPTGSHVHSMCRQHVHCRHILHPVPPTVPPCKAHGYITRLYMRGDNTVIVFASCTTYVPAAVRAQHAPLHALEPWDRCGRLNRRSASRKRRREPQRRRRQIAGPVWL